MQLKRALIESYCNASGSYLSAKVDVGALKEPYQNPEPVEVPETHRSWEPEITFEGSRTPQKQDDTPQKKKYGARKAAV